MRQIALTLCAVVLAGGGCHVAEQRSEPESGQAVSPRAVSQPTGTIRGVVTLRGKVQDPKAKSHASDVVRGVPGVRSVRNELAL